MLFIYIVCLPLVVLSLLSLFNDFSPCEDKSINLTKDKIFEYRENAKFKIDNSGTILVSGTSKIVNLNGLRKLVYLNCFSRNGMTFVKYIAKTSKDTYLYIEYNCYHDAIEVINTGAMQNIKHYILTCENGLTKYEDLFGYLPSEI